jgi:SPOR domain
MTWQHRGELRADPGIAPGDRNIDPPKRRSIWPSIAVVAAASAFGGVIWYAYHQSPGAGGNGLPPLVKAEPGPVKVKPDNPGGQEIPFQDSTVYDRLSQNGQKPVVEKLLPPPEQPATRTPPPPPPAEATAAPPLPSPDAQIAQQPVAPPQQTAPALLPPVDVGAPTALAPAPGAIVIQPPPPPQPKPTEVAPSLPPKTAIVEAAKPQAAAKPTPTSIAALITEAGVSAQPAPKASANGGTYRLQLSAVRSPDAVPAEWARLKRRYPELAGLTSSTNKIDTPDKGTFYRLEAGPLDEAEAKSTCTHLRGQGLGCIVVRR